VLLKDVFAEALRVSIAEVWHRARRHGLLTRSLGNVIVLMPPLWQSLFRPREEMMGLFHWIVIGQAGLALSFVMIYASGFAGGGVASGVRLGIMLEILATSARCAFYATQPFPAKLLVLISVGGFIEMIVTDIIVGAIYKSAVARTS
jgi:hypothetical protein